MDNSFLQYVTLVFPIITLISLILFFRYYTKASLPLTGTTEWITRIIENPRLTLTYRRHRMTRQDILPVLVITIIYAATAFFRLGDMQAPQSFFRFSEADDSIVITLNEPTDIGSITYYPGLFVGGYALEFSSDGSNWQEQYPDMEKNHKSAMDQPHSGLFKWQRADINGDNVPTRYIRITASSTPLELGELAICTKFGSMVPSYSLSCPNAPQLFDEQEAVPDAPGYMNSMYFDEINYGRTAYEHTRNVAPYETTHPPLGKLIIALGIELFGMAPFGWRFMGTLFGVLMLPILYIFLKNMFGKTVIAACGTALFAADFMHFVQTRISSIDSFAVFFILVSYFFMYRYITQHPEQPLKKTLLPLALSGLFFGLGCATKWIAVFAGLGLLALYVFRLAMNARYYKENELDGFSSVLLKTLGLSAVFFIAVPAVIYCLSYIMYGRAAGMTVSGGMLWDAAYYSLIWENQKHMLTYHTTLAATHSYASAWYQWLVDGRPVLYFLDDSMGGGTKSAFAAFGNPVVWWGGFMAIIAMGWRALTHKDGKALFILVGYLAQLVPWFFITRVVFIYHYFPCVIFMVLALSHVLGTLWERRQGRYKLAVYGLPAAAVLLFGAFYPVLSGVPAPESYTKYLLCWFPFSWPF